MIKSFLCTVVLFTTRGTITDMFLRGKRLHCYISARKGVWRTRFSRFLKPINMWGRRQLTLCPSLPNVDNVGVRAMAWKFVQQMHGNSQRSALSGCEAHLCKGKTNGITMTLLVHVITQSQVGRCNKTERYRKEGDHVRGQ